jgi:hypothetical protein
MALTAQHISQLSSEQVDDLFRSGRVGQIPDGEADGTAIFWPGTLAEPFVEAFVEAVAWKGKVVNARGRQLKNRISPLGVPAIAADVYTDRSWFDGGDCIVLDYSKRSLVAKFVRDEIRKVAPGLYLGLVYLGRTRTIYFTLQFTV